MALDRVRCTQPLGGASENVVIGGRVDKADRFIAPTVLDYGSDLDQFKALNYLIGECNYGGRVTDDKDRRYLLCILADFYNPNVFDADYKFSPSGTYKPPTDDLTSYDAVLEFNMALPLTQLPEIFGLHDNADITKDQQETNYFCDTVLSTESSASSGSSAGGGKSADEILDDLVAVILEQIPEQ